MGVKSVLPYSFPVQSVKAVLDLKSLTWKKVWGIILYLVDFINFKPI